VTVQRNTFTRIGNPKSSSSPGASVPGRAHRRQCFGQEHVHQSGGSLGDSNYLLALVATSNQHQRRVNTTGGSARATETEQENLRQADDPTLGRRRLRALPSRPPVARPRQRSTPTPTPTPTATPAPRPRPHPATRGRSPSHPQAGPTSLERRQLPPGRRRLLRRRQYRRDVPTRRRQRRLPALDSPAATTCPAWAK